MGMRARVPGEPTADARLNPPAHALVDDSGNAWRCEDGFRKRDQLCVVER